MHICAWQCQPSLHMKLGQFKTTLYIAVTAAQLASLKTYVTPVFRNGQFIRALGGNVKLTFPLVFICHFQYAYTYHGANYACVLLFTYSLYWYRTSLHYGLLIHIGFSINFTVYAILLFCVSHRTLRLKFYISFSSNVIIYKCGLVQSPIMYGCHLF